MDLSRKVDPDRRGVYRSGKPVTQEWGVKNDPRKYQTKPGTSEDPKTVDDGCWRTVKTTQVSTV